MPATPTPLSDDERERAELVLYHLTKLDFPDAAVFQQVKENLGHRGRRRLFTGHYLSPGIGVTDSSETLRDINRAFSHFLGNPTNCDIEISNITSRPTADGSAIAEYAEMKPPKIDARGLDTLQTIHHSVIRRYGSKEVVPDYDFGQYVKIERPMPSLGGIIITSKPSWQESLELVLQAFEDIGSEFDEDKKRQSAEVLLKRLGISASTPAITEKNTRLVLEKCEEARTFFEEAAKLNLAETLLQTLGIKREGKAR